MNHYFPSFYHSLQVDLWAAIKYVNMTKTTNVLVIGSHQPWVEALALAGGAMHVWTLEYARLFTSHPRVTTLLPGEFLSAARGGRLPPIDVVITASSVEHSGLGRYNDGLNPWGDILAIARAWCVVKPDAHLIVSVPMSAKFKGREATTDADAVSNSMDTLKFNTERVYGPLRYPYLVTNWKFEHRVDTHRGNWVSWAQTVYVFRRMQGSRL